MPKEKALSGHCGSRALRRHGRSGPRMNFFEGEGSTSDGPVFGTKGVSDASLPNSQTPILRSLCGLAPLSLLYHDLRT